MIGPQIFLLEWLIAFVVNAVIRLIVIGPFTPDTFMMALESFFLAILINLFFSGGMSRLCYSIGIWLLWKRGWKQHDNWDA